MIDTFQIGRYEEAIKHYEKAIEIDTKFEDQGDVTSRAVMSPDLRQPFHTRGFK